MDAEHRYTPGSGIRYGSHVGVGRATICHGVGARAHERADEIEQRAPRVAKPVAA